MGVYVNKEIFLKAKEIATTVIKECICQYVETSKFHCKEDMKNDHQLYIYIAEAFDNIVISDKKQFKRG